VAARALSDPEGWAFYQLKTELLKRLPPRQAHAAFGEFLTDLGAVVDGSGALLRLADVAAAQPVCMTYSAAETLHLPGARLPAGQRSPAFSLKARALFIARLDDATIYGRSNLLQVDGALITDLQADESDRYRTQEWFDPIVSARDGDVVLVHLPAGPDRLQLPEAIDLTGVFSPGWGHCVLEFVPQLLLADAVAKVSPAVPLLVDAHLPAPFYDLFRFISPDRAQIRLHFRQPAHVKQLWAGSSPEFWPALRAPGQSLRAEQSSLNPNALARLLRHAPKAAGWADPALRRLFLARSGDVRLSNHAAVAERLAAEGFVTVFPEKLSLHDQLVMVQNATHVAGAWGSQMMLALVLGRPDLRVLLMSGPDMEEGPSLALAAEARGQHVIVLQGQVTQADPSLPYNTLYAVDQEALAAALVGWL
jgi:capsular polysaccharide biosynthesis protein